MSTTTERESGSMWRLREELSTPQMLAERLAALQESKADYIVDTRRAHMSGGDTLTFDLADATVSGPVNDYAHGQIGTRLGIPKKYYDRMRGDAPALLDENVNHWFRSQPEQRMVRMLEGRVRAFLSNRYRRLDNWDLMERAVLPEFARFGDRLQFHVAALTDTRLYVRAILPDLAADVEIGSGNHTFLAGPEGGDVVQAGVQIRNSEVGAGKLDVSPFIWRIRCLNGLVVSEAGLSRYHVGRAQDEEDFTIYATDTLAADDEAFFLKVRDMVRAALDEVQFRGIVDQMRDAASSEQIQSPVKATQVLAKTNALTDGEQESILAYLTRGGDLSQWGLVNAITASAKDAGGYDRQVELETLGGELLAADEAEWARIAAR